MRYARPGLRGDSKRGASAAAIRTNFDAKRYGNSTGAVGRINGKDTPCSSTGLFGFQEHESYADWRGPPKFRGAAEARNVRLMAPTGLRPAEPVSLI